MKAILMVDFEADMRELVGILASNGYTVKVKRTGEVWEEPKYQVEVSKDESNISD